MDDDKSSENLRCGAGGFRVGPLARFSGQGVKFEIETSFASSWEVEIPINENKTRSLKFQSILHLSYRR